MPSPEYGELLNLVGLARASAAESSSADANYAQAVSSGPEAATTIDSAPLAFTTRVSGKVRVWASTVVTVSVANELVLGILLLDGAAYGPSPTPTVSAANVGNYCQLTIEWVVKTTLGPHTFGIRAISTTVHNMGGQQQVVTLQELPQ